MDTSKYFRSFSGADSLVFIIIPNCKPICLGTITTISYSIFRDKAPVSLIGRVNVGGFTRGPRVVAGTMVFTILNQNWVNELMDQLPGLAEYKSLKADELPIFDLMIVSANEYGAAVNGFIYGVDVTEEGQVVSVEDLFTENVCKFIARDIDVFKEDKKPGKNVNGERTISGFSVGYPGYRGGNDNELIVSGNGNNEPIEIQRRLNHLGYKVNESGKFDNYTMNAISQFQKDNGIHQTGYIDSKTANKLYGMDEYKYVCDKRYNVPVYSEPNVKSEIVRYLNHHEVIKNSYSISEFEKIDDGYVKLSDLVDIEPYILTKSHKELNVPTLEVSAINGYVWANFENLEADIKIKVSAICRYMNGKKDTFSKMIYSSNKQDIKVSTENINEAFLYNPKVDSVPKTVEFIVSPIGYEPIKYILEVVR